MNLQALLSGVAQVPDRIRENREFFQAMLTLAKRPAEDERQAALAMLGDWMARKQYYNALQPARNSPKGAAERLLGEPRIRDALLAIPHLGCLSPLSRISATRLDYVYLITDALLEIKHRNPGLGLGSIALRWPGGDLTGLELAQSWAVLWNCGHLFGTFATERALLYYIDNSRELKDELLALVPSGFRKKARRIVAERSMYRLFYVLASIRLPRLIGSPLAELVSGIMEEFPADSAPRFHQNLLWAFRKARQIAYCRLHSLLRQGISFEESSYPQLVRYLRQYEGLGFDPILDQVSAAANLLSALDTFHSESVFGTLEASSLVLAHLRAFRVWWKRQDEEHVRILDRIVALSERPRDWPEERTTNLRHYHRMVLPRPKDGWIVETRDWLGDRTEWVGSDFLITPPPDDRGALVYDLYSDRHLHPRTAHHVARLLGLRNAATWQSRQESDRDVWRAVASFGLRLLQDILQPGYSAILQPSTARDGHIGYAFVCQGAKTVRSRLRTFMQASTDGSKKNELCAIADYLPSDESADSAHILVFLGRLLFMDTDSKRQAKEIDGAMAWLNADRIEWFFFEHKSGARGAGKSQLAALGELIAAPLSEPISRACSYGRSTMVRTSYGSEENT